MTTKNAVPCILIVDDSKSMRLAIGSMIEERGYIVDYAEDGVHALEKIQLFLPDLILLDVVMPRKVLGS